MEARKFLLCPPYLSSLDRLDLEAWLKELKEYQGQYLQAGVTCAKAEDLIEESLKELLKAGSEEKWADEKWQLRIHQLLGPPAQEVISKRLQALRLTEFTELGVMRLQLQIVQIGNELQRDPQKWLNLPGVQEALLKAMPGWLQEEVRGWKALQDQVGFQDVVDRTIEIVRDRERMNIKGYHYRGPSVKEEPNAGKSRTRVKKEISCFKCGAMGHYANECRSSRKPSEDTGIPKRSSQPRKEVTDVSCFRCGEAGHYANQCPQGRTPEGMKNSSEVKGPNNSCYRCKEEGHFARDCPNYTRNAKRVQVAKTTTGKWGKLARVIVNPCREEFEAIWDTGAEICLLDRRVLNGRPELQSLEKQLETPLVIKGCGEQTARTKIEVWMEHPEEWIQITMVVLEDLPVDVVLDATCFEAYQGKYPEKIQLFGVDAHAEIQAGRMMAILAEYPRVNGEEDAVRELNLEPFQIELEPGTTPKRKMPYPTSQGRNERIQQQVDELLRKGFIRESRSPWAANALLVPKKNGELRMVINYRPLNSVTKRDAYPLPRMDTQLEYIAGGKFFVVLDLKSGYHQLDVEEKSRELTAFNTPRGLYEFKRMPFGLMNAPAHFCRVMQQVLAGLTPQRAVAYLDDVLIMGKTPEALEENMRAVCERFQQYGLVVNTRKCDFRVKEVKYLGYSITAKGKGIDPDRKQGLREMRRPENVTALKSFLGTVSFFRGHIPNLARRAASLYELLTRNQDFVWNQEREEAFKDLKEGLVEAPILSHPDFRSSFELQTDASTEGIGAVLKQGEKVVAFVSRTLSKAEKNYSTMELEGLAIFWAVKKLRPLLLDQDFVIQTDHRNLKYLESLSNDRVKRWMTFLEEYRFAVEYNPGKNNVIADMLSRTPGKVAMPGLRRKPSQENAAPLEENRMDEDSGSATEEDWGQQSEAETETEEEERATEGSQASEEIRDWFRESQSRFSAEEVESMERNTDYQKTQDGIWIRKEVDKDIVIIPREGKELQNRVMVLAHDIPSSGHMGVARTKARLSGVDWDTKNRDVSSFVKTCIECQRVRGGERAGTLHLWQVQKPLEVVHLDFMGPFTPCQGSGNRFILVMVDRFSKIVQMVAMRTIDAESTGREFLGKWIALYGVPKRVITDNGPQFTAQVMKSILRRAGIQHHLITPYNAKANGQVERINRVIGETLRLTVGEERNKWDEKLPLIQMAINSAINRTTGYAPYEIVHGRKMREFGAAGVEQDDEEEPEDMGHYLERLQESSLEIGRAVEQATTRSMRQYKEEYDARRTKKQLRVGDFVLEYTSGGNKLRDNKFGPLQVVKDCGKDVFEVRVLTSEPEIGNDPITKKIARANLQLIDLGRYQLTTPFIYQQYRR